MDLNKLKTVVRSYYYEYLKKRAEYGWIIPRIFQLQIFGSERINNEVEFQTALRGYWGLLSEYVARGASHRFCSYVGAFTGNLRRRIRVRSELGEKFRSTFTTIPLMILFTPVTLGGVGALPWTLIGANKDAVSYIMYDPIIRERVSQAAFVADVGNTQIVKSIVKETMKTDTFSKGVRWLKQQQDGERVLAAMQASSALEKVGINLGRFDYRRSAIRMVEASIADNPSLRKVINESKRGRSDRVILNRTALKDMFVESKPLFIKVSNFYVGSNLARLDSNREDVVGMFYDDLFSSFKKENGITFNVVEQIERANRIVNESGKSLIVYSLSLDSELSVEGDTFPLKMGGVTFNDFQTLRSAILIRVKRSKSFLKNSMDSEFKWLEAIKFRYGDEIPVRLSFNPVAGLSPGLGLMMRQIGVSSVADSQALRLNKALLTLARDPLFPADLRVETVFEILSSPIISSSESNITNALIVMGASSEAAGQIAQNFSNISGDVTFLRKTQSYSTADQIIGHMDLSVINYDRLVSIDLLQNTKFSSVIRALGALYVLCYPDHRLRSGADYVPTVDEVVIPRRKALAMVDNKSVIDVTFPSLLGKLFNKSLKFQNVFSYGVFDDR
jgi:hypothetical protein